MKVLAVDPGYGTGWATYDTLTGEFESGEVWTFAEACVQIEYLMSDPALLEVIVEDYIITERTTKLTQQKEPLTLQGMVHHEALKRDFGFTLQMPLDPKKPKARRILKALGWFVKTKDDHANAAAYHLYTYLSNRGMLNEVDRYKLIRMLNDDPS